MLTQAPIFISSPVRRSGTTLLQRLYTGTGEAIIFGESVANDLMVAGQMLQMKKQTFVPNRLLRDQMLERVRNGSVNEWIPDLLPPIPDYLNLHEKLLNDLINGFANEAEKLGRGQWGVKLPEWPIHSLRYWQQRMPESKTIYIVRDLEECVASATTIGMIGGDQYTAQFRQIYQQHLAQAKQHLSKETTYFLDYADLVDPAKANDQLKALGEFCGLPTLPKEVLAVRVGDYNQ